MPPTGGYAHPAFARTWQTMVKAAGSSHHVTLEASPQLCDPWSLLAPLQHLLPTPTVATTAGGGADVDALTTRMQQLSVAATATPASTAVSDSARCAATYASGAKAGEQCSNRAKPGSAFCGIHRNRKLPTKA